MGFISPYEPLFRVGVILRQPPAPGAIGGGLTVSDDLYLVGTLDEHGSPDCLDHGHVAQPLLFPFEHRVAAELREALKKGHEGYGRQASDL